MPSLSPFEILLMVWAAVTTVFLVFVLYRSLVAMKEEDTLFLSAAEANMEQEQRQIQRRLQRINPYTRGLGFTSAGLLAVILGILAYAVARDLMT